MKTILFLLMSCLAVASGYAKEQVSKEGHMEQETTPKYLYKVITTQEWQQSQSMKQVKLPSADNEFIHFSREDQLDRLIGKYWASAPEYVVLKIEASKLAGKLVFEPNPGGENKYYHLYNGSIPLKAVVESRVVATAQKSVK